LFDIYGWFTLYIMLPFCMGECSNLHVSANMYLAGMLCMQRMLKARLTNYGMVWLLKHHANHVQLFYL